MFGVWVLAGAVVVAAVGTLVGAGRRAARVARLGRAERRIRQALLVDAGDASRARIAALAGSVRSLTAAEAGSLVLASRRSFSRDIVPILVAALGHRDQTVREDASRALADLGSPGLLAAWQSLDAAPDGADGPEAFLLRHPDWLFQRLVEGYAAEGEASVRRHERLWRQSGMMQRLTLLQAGSDAINALRGSAICHILGSGGDRVA